MSNWNNKSREPTTSFGKHVEMTAEEINEFLTHSGDSGDSDDSDWEGIAEMETETFMQPSVAVTTVTTAPTPAVCSPQLPGCSLSAKEGEENELLASGRIDEEGVEKEETPKKQKKKMEEDVEDHQPHAKRFKKQDIGVGMLFAKPGDADNETGDDLESRHRRNSGSDEDILDEGNGPSYLSLDGALVQNRLKADRAAVLDSRFERELAEEERKQKQLQLMEERRKRSLECLRTEMTKVPSTSVASSVVDSKSGKQPLNKQDLPAGNYFVATPTRIRVVRPRISSELWTSRTCDRTTYPLSQLASLRHRGVDLASQEWITVGVLVSKSGSRRSKKGALFSVWRLNDLEKLDQMVSVLLFGGVHDALWKEVEGSVVALLKPKLMDATSDGKQVSGKSLIEEVTLTVNNAMQILILGHSVDYGVCAGVTKAGNNCSKFVNTGVCKYCDFHVKKAYSKASVSRPGFANTTFPTFQTSKKTMHSVNNPSGTPGTSAQNFDESSAPRPGILTKMTLSKLCSRPELSSSMVDWGLVDSASLAKIPSSSGVDAVGIEKGKQAVTSTASQRGTTAPLKVAHRAALLAKNEAAFASMLTRPSAGSINFVKHLLKTEAPNVVAHSDRKKRESSKKEQQKPLEKKGKGETASVPSLQGGSSFKGFFTSMRTDKIAPQLGRGMSSEGLLDLTSPPSTKNMKKKRETQEALANRRKAEALIRSKGGLLPGWSKDGVGAVLPAVVAARAVAAVPSKAGSGTSKGMSVEERQQLEKELSRGSKHRDLVDREEAVAEEAFFSRLGKKEELEDRLLALHEQKVVLVFCKQCRYKSLGASEKCKSLGHSLVRSEGFRRFFKCSNCKQRTTTLDRYPKVACNKCQGSSFVKAGMIPERKGPKLVDETLELRGEERKFLGS